MSTPRTTSRRSTAARRLLALLAVLMLVAAACSSGDDDTSAADDAAQGEGDPPDDASDASETDAGAGDAGGDGEASGSDDDATGDDAEDPELSTELGQGVTEDTITIGYSYLDLDRLREQGVVDLNHGPGQEHMQAMVDHINANGGIHGRQLEVVFSSFSPVDPDAQQAGCLELTEDHGVFAILGALREDNVLCYTEQHETIAIANAGMTAERLDRARAPYADGRGRPGTQDRGVCCRRRCRGPVRRPHPRGALDRLGAGGARHRDPSVGGGRSRGRIRVAHRG